MCAQNTVPEDEKGPSHLQQDKPPQEQPNPLPADKMNEPGSISTGQLETDVMIRAPELATMSFGKY